MHHYCCFSLLRLHSFQSTEEGSRVNILHLQHLRNTRLLQRLYNKSTAAVPFLFEHRDMVCSTDGPAGQISSLPPKLVKNYHLTHPHCRLHEFSSPPLASPCFLPRAPQAAVRVSQPARLSVCFVAVASCLYCWARRGDSQIVSH